MKRKKEKITSTVRVNSSVVMRLELSSSGLVSPIWPVRLSMTKRSLVLPDVMV